MHMHTYATPDHCMHMCMHMHACACQVGTLTILTISLVLRITAVDEYGGHRYGVAHGAAGGGSSALELDRELLLTGGNVYIYTCACAHIYLYTCAHLLRTGGHVCTRIHMNIYTFCAAAAHGRSRMHMPCTCLLMRIYAHIDICIHTCSTCSREVLSVRNAEGVLHA